MALHPLPLAGKGSRRVSFICDGPARKGEARAYVHAMISGVSWSFSRWIMSFS